MTCVLLCIACVGMVSLVRHRHPLGAPLILVFVLPFCLYWFFGVFGGRFGHPRNLFYLLPLYWLFVSVGLSRLFTYGSALSNFAKWICAAMICVWQVVVAVRTTLPRVQKVSAMRSMFESVAIPNVSCAFVKVTGPQRKQFEFYADYFTQRTGTRIHLLTSGESLRAVVAAARVECPHVALLTEGPTDLIDLDATVHTRKVRYSSVKIGVVEEAFQFLLTAKSDAAQFRNGDVELIYERFLTTIDFSEVPSLVKGTSVNTLSEKSGSQ